MLASGRPRNRTKFGYDPLDRLTSVSLNGISTLSVDYDAIGNISNKSDLGAYNYTAQQAGCSYTGLSAQPHAVRNAGGSAYCYDANGNMTSRSGATVSWYSFNYPLTISQAGGNTSTFYYTPDRSRYRQVSLNGSTSEDRTYVRELFEKLTSSAQGIQFRHYIMAGDKKIAVRLIASGVDHTYYFHDDHLGSTGALTDETGAVKIQESFDAWGKRRGSAWSGAPSAADFATINNTTHIGFTAQEELDNLSLVDLNGRVYDPTVARFMSADPEVQAPHESQSLNRYSYTFDNPLNATDPTGFECTGSHIDSAAMDSAACATTAVAYQGPADNPQRQANFAAAFGSQDGQNSNSAQRLDDGGTAGLQNSRDTNSASNGSAIAGQMEEVDVNATRLSPGSRHPMLNIFKTVFDVIGLLPIPIVSSIANLASAGVSLAEGDRGEAALSAAAAIPLVGEIAVLAKGAKLAREAKEAAEGGMAGVRALGLAGEDAVRAAYDIGPATRITLDSGAFRVPDGLLPDVLSEVKNVQSLSFTRQLRDFSNFAQSNGLRFDLYVRPTTQLSGPLQDAIDSGLINRLFIPQ